MEQLLTPILSQMRRYWGYDDFRPLQREAMECVMQRRDSVVVLPTGGGKSLCFQAPAVAMPGLAIVVSPLIALMKDQVDALRACGVGAACLNSSLDYDVRREVFADVRRGAIKLLYAAPERVVMESFVDFLRSIDVSFIAIDEAHCISTWGHQFRPEYRALRVLRDTFPNIAIHAYTATATRRVREDIAAQLGLHEPSMLVGPFDRPNLTYRVVPRTNELEQVLEVIDRHRGDSGVIYCISRKKVEQLAEQLTACGHRALPYHAGLDDAVRHRNQEAFIREEVEIIVATVAFGMGIDKSNVRFVLHAAMPKSIEDYTQESGRAGRDGLEAECCLLHGGGDFMSWKRMLADLEPEPRAVAHAKLERIGEYCRAATCRHCMLIQYFGQDGVATPCGACDACLDELPHVTPLGSRDRRAHFDSPPPPRAPAPPPPPLESDQIIGQKIASCIVRLKEAWDADYTARVLLGQSAPAMAMRGHDALSTFGLLRGHAFSTVLHWIQQLVAQDYLAANKAGALGVTEIGWRLLRGEVMPRLERPAAAPPASPHRGGEESAFDAQLFEKLRVLRRTLADAQQMPAYIVFSDAVLRELARLRPTKHDHLLAIKGVGERKAHVYGAEFLMLIREHGA